MTTLPAKGHARYLYQALRLIDNVKLWLLVSIKWRQVVMIAITFSLGMVVMQDYLAPVIGAVIHTTYLVNYLVDRLPLIICGGFIVWRVKA